MGTFMDDIKAAKATATANTTAIGGHTTTIGGHTTTIGEHTTTIGEHTTAIAAATAHVAANPVLPITGVDYVSTANAALATAYAAGETLGDVTLAEGDRILLMAQTDAKENGIYVVAAEGAPTRALDAATGAAIAGKLVVVTKATAPGAVYQVTSNSVFGTDDVTIVLRDIAAT